MQLGTDDGAWDRGISGRGRSRGRAGLAAALLALALTGGCSPGPGMSGGAPGVATASRRSPLTTREAFAAVPHDPVARVCNGGRWRCLALVRTYADGTIKPLAQTGGLGATDLEAAYDLDPSVDPQVSVAIVGAYDYPNAESDLAQYRSHYGLPPCTIASGCLRIVNQDGQPSPLPGPPPFNDDWTQETALDLDMVSAACPKCKLILVEANDDQGDGLFIANDAAAALAPIVSNSWGGPESSQNAPSKYESYLNHPGVSVFVATGDSGYDDGGQGPDYPGTSAYVTGVGGTTLVQDASARGWSEQAWRNGGSSCSLSVPKPAWEPDTVCQYRASSDVAAVGDPQTGVATYNAGAGGFVTVGGTSAATPFVAGVYALTGLAGVDPSFAYTYASSFHDVTSGSNGFCGTVDCNAGTGWDGPTGVGTPDGASLAAICFPSCGGKQCGDDGCGGSCGTCAGAMVCDTQGQCLEPPTEVPPPPLPPALEPPPPPDGGSGSPSSPGGGAGSPHVAGGCGCGVTPGAGGGGALELLGLLGLLALGPLRRRASWPQPHDRP